METLSLLFEGQHHMARIVWSARSESTTASYQNAYQWSTAGNTEKCSSVVMLGTHQVRRRLINSQVLSHSQLIMPNAIVSKRRGRRGRQPTQGGDSVGKYFGDVWSLAKRTAAGLNEIRKLVNVEEKFLDVSGSQTVSSTGSIVALSQIAQGSDYTNRVGDSIKLQRIEFRAKYIMNTASTGTILRVIIFRDLFQQGVDPTVTNVIGGTGALNPKNFLLRDRFSLLYDELCYMSNVGEDGGVIQFSMPHEGHVKYIGTTAATASNGFGSIYMLLLSDEATNVPTFTWHSSIYFTDD